MWVPEKRSQMVAVSVGQSYSVTISDVTQRCKDRQKKAVWEIWYFIPKCVQAHLTFPSRMVSHVACFLLTGLSSIPCMDTSYSPSSSCNLLQWTNGSAWVRGTVNGRVKRKYLTMWITEFYLFLSKTVICATYVSVASPSSLWEELLFFLLGVSVTSEKSSQDKQTNKNIQPKFAIIFLTASPQRAACLKIH